MMKIIVCVKSGIWGLGFIQFEINGAIHFFGVALRVNQILCKVINSGVWGSQQWSNNCTLYLPFDYVHNNAMFFRCQVESGPPNTSKWHRKWSTKYNNIDVGLHTFLIIMIAPTPMQTLIGVEITEIEKKYVIWKFLLKSLTIQEIYWRWLKIDFFHF